MFSCLRSSLVDGSVDSESLELGKSPVLLNGSSPLSSGAPMGTRQSNMLGFIGSEPIYSHMASHVRI